MINQIVSPTPTQAITLAMSDYIHPSLDVDNTKHSTDKNVMLWDGTRGSGKTDGVLWELKQEIDKGFGYEFKAIVFRINYNDLEDFMDKAENFFINQLKYDCKIKRGASRSIEFATGEKILFRIMRNIEDYKKYHGHGYQFIIFEEATLWKDINDIMIEMMSCLRSPYNQKYKTQIAAGLKKKMILKMRLTTNPFGVSKMMLKKVFVDNQKAGCPWIDTGITYMRFRSTFLDNPYITDDYINNFLKLSNKEKVKAWVYGDWNAKSSGAFGELFKPEIFCLPSFKIPKNWRVDRCLDWGRRDPFSVLWFAECDGTEVKFMEGGKERVFCPPKGTIIVINEYYGGQKDNPKLGIGINATEVAKNIKIMEKRMYRQDLAQYHSIDDGVADNSICAQTGNVHTIEDLFRAEGIHFKKSDKSSGSRERGVDLMIEMMNDTLEKNHEKRHIYVMSNNCPNWIDNVMSLEYQDGKNDVETKNVPDHDWDTTRYRILDRVRKTYSSNTF